MDIEHTDELVFFVNGKKIVERFPDPEASLLQYLRRSLPGTKEGCGHGGCGSCTVMVSRCDPTENKICHYTVNACLFPLCAAHGLAITTVEGVGNPKTGLHDVQRRLVESHGLQCGFCTPGFVMSVFTLLRNNPTPTRDELEKAIEGNLCRCTGYRPIVQAFTSLCKDACPQGEMCCKNQKDVPSEQEKGNQPSSQVKTSSAVAEAEQVAIFPSELQLTNKYCASLVKFKGPKWAWIRPTTYKELLKLKADFQDAPVIMGNTTAALLIKLGKFTGRCLIYGGGIASLKQASLVADGIELGAALTINELDVKLKELSGKIKETQRRHFPAFLRMIERYGADQIRNTATISGSILSGRSNSDITTILAACGATAIIETEHSSRKEPVDNLTLKRGEVMKSVILPITKENDFIVFYKQAERQTFSLAIINCCIHVQISDSGEIKRFRMVFGGISGKVAAAEKQLSKYCGRSWDHIMLTDILADLPELMKQDGATAVDPYKLAVVSGFVFKFYNHVSSAMTSSDALAYSVLADTLDIRPSSGTQLYTPFTDPGQCENDALHRPIPNVSSEAIVSGEAAFVDDMRSAAGELFLALVTSKRAHAKILKVDPSAALDVPGVVGIIDHTDIKGLNRWGSLFPEEELFATKEVICYGQPIAAVIAETREIARNASYLVKIEYQDLKVVLTQEDAIQEDTFYNTRIELSDGDTGKGFTASDQVIEGEYRTGFQEHFYLEPFSCVIYPRNECDELDVNVTTQNRDNTQETLSSILAIPLNKITCTVRRIGGGFGGKEGRTNMIVGPSAIAAQKHSELFKKYKTVRRLPNLGKSSSQRNNPVKCWFENISARGITKYKRPIRSVLTREMDMEITGKRHAYLAKYKVGVMNSGEIQSLDLTIYSNGGCSMDLSLIIMDKTQSDFNGGYKIKNLKFTGITCKTNMPSNTAFRSFGSPEGLLVMEDIIFKIACTLGLSQETIREANWFKTGDLTKYGLPLMNYTIPELWERCKEQSDFIERSKEVAAFNRSSRWRKRGLVMTAERFTIGFNIKELYRGAAIVNIYKDGTVVLSHGGVEMGQGMNTKMIQIASRVLGIPTDLIYTSDSNTRCTPNVVFTAGSMGTDVFGPAVMDSCQILMERLEPTRKDNPNVSWKDLIKKAYQDRVKLTATGFSRYPKVPYDPVTKTGSKADYYTYGTICTEVEIDVLTGENQVLQADIVMDVGKSLNPAIDIGQIEGGFVQGLGMVTSEYIDVDEKGKMMNCSPVSYKIPNVRSIPRKFNVTLVQEDSITTPVYSAKAIGEPPLLLSISVIMAIKEAVRAARAEIGLQGYFQLDSPATVERIRLACGDQLSKI